MKHFTTLVTTVILAASFSLMPVSARYEPNWPSLESRPIPEWYDEAKIGIFITWGVYSVPATGHQSEWFWENWKEQGKKYPQIPKFMHDNYRPDFTYQDFAKDFKTEFYNATEWVNLFADAGAKYVIFMTKHHDGYTLYPSKTSFSWNSMDVGPRRDLVGEMAQACRARKDMTFGIYHSYFEWFNPLFLSDQKNNYTTTAFVDSKAIPEMNEILHKYKPEVWFSDGEWMAPPKYWKSLDWLAWLYNDSPVKDTIVVNDRWGKGTWCKHGGVITCGDYMDPGYKYFRKFCDTRTLDVVSWGYRRNVPLSAIAPIEDLIQKLVSTVACGGNMVINVGIPSHGYIMPIYEERLRQFGSWLKVNGEGIYKSKPWTFVNDTLQGQVWYTMQNRIGQRDIYAYSYKFIDDPVFTLHKPQVSNKTKITLLGFGDMKYKPRSPKGVDIIMPRIPYSNVPKYVWGFRITNVVN